MTNMLFSVKPDGVLSLPDGSYGTIRNTRMNRWRTWLAMRVFRLVIPKATEILTIKTTTGSAGRGLSRCKYELKN